MQDWISVGDRQMVNEIMTLEDIKRAREGTPPLSFRTKRPSNDKSSWRKTEELREQREIDKINDAEAYYNDLFPS